MGKQPHIDFEQRAELDGTEEFYTQNANYTPTEQKFTLSAVKAFILHAIQTVTGSNGLSGANSLGLGGILNKHTTVDAGNFKMLFKKGKRGVELADEDLEGNPSANIHSESVNGSKAILAALLNGQVRLVSANGDNTKFTRLALMPTFWSILRKSDDLESSMEMQGSFIRFESKNNTTGKVAFLMMDEASGTNIHNPQKVQLETSEDGVIQIITSDIANPNAAPDIEAGYLLGLKTNDGEVEYKLPNRLPIQTKTANYQITAKDSTIIADASANPFNITLPNAALHKGYFFRIVSATNNANTVNISAKAGQIQAGSSITALIELAQNERKTFQSDGTNWVWID